MADVAYLNGFPLVCTAISCGDKGDRKMLCHGSLAARDALTLACRDCGAEYPLRDGLPILLAHDNATPAAAYDDELLAQAYVEMNFASYRTDVARAETSAVDPSDSVALGRRLMEHTDLTGNFYERMADLVTAHQPEGTSLVADVACGMARMGPELARRGFGGRYLGLDLSWRLVAEAARVFLGGASEIRLPIDLARGPCTKVVPIAAPRLDPGRTLLGVSDAHRLPLADGSCDVVLGLNLVDRLKEPVAVVRELWRCVGSGGILVLADPFHWQEQALDQRFYALSAAKAWLDDADEVVLSDDERSVLFVTRRRDSRRVVVYDDEVAIFRRLPPASEEAVAQVDLPLAARGAE